MVNKIASSGLCMQHLQLAFSRNEDKGIELLFSDRDVNGKLRVTKSKKIISLLNDYLKSI